MISDRIVVSNKKKKQKQKKKTLNRLSERLYEIDWLSIQCTYTGTYPEMVNLYILINIERVSKHSVTILGQRVVKPAGLDTGQSYLPLQASRVG